MYFSIHEIRLLDTNLGGSNLILGIIVVKMGRIVFLFALRFEDMYTEIVHDLLTIYIYYQSFNPLYDVQILTLYLILFREYEINF